MIKRSQIVLSGFFIVFTACMALAKDDKIPVIDLQKRCGISEKAVQELLGDYSKKEDAFKSCITAEREARNAIASVWKEIPPSYKLACVAPKSYSASYIEWIACLELYIDVKKMRSK